MVFNGGISASEKTGGADAGSCQQRTCTGGPSADPSPDVTTGSRGKISSRQTEQTGNGMFGSAAMVFLTSTRIGFRRPLLGPAFEANGGDDGGRGLLRYGVVHSSSHVA
jgi:hypothetical protein